MSEWRPLFARFDPEKAIRYDALHDGVPPWMTRSLIDWAFGQIYQSDLVRRPLAAEILKFLERRLRIALDWRNGTDGAVASAVSAWVADQELFLSAVDCLLSRIDNPMYDEVHRRALSTCVELFDDAGSAWKAIYDRNDGVCRLQRRIQPETEAVLALVTGRPADYLRQSWTRAFGREPLPDGAYRDAIRALEAALKPVVSPDNHMTTLGSVIRDVRAKPEKWLVRLAPSQGDPVLMFAEELQMLWTAQLDRHGTNDESVPLNVTPEQAQDAVVRATSLVHLVQSGGFRLV